MKRLRVAVAAISVWGVLIAVSDAQEPGTSPTIESAEFGQFAEQFHTGTPASDSTVLPTGFHETSGYQTPLPCDGVTGCDQTAPAAACGDEECFLYSDTPLLSFMRDRPLGDSGWKYSVGGELRHRYMDEHNRLRPRGTETRHRYNLWRFAPYLEMSNGWLTGRVQGIDASIFGEDIPALPIDENRWELLQYYLDVKFLEEENGAAHLRYGRQFLLYGDQHLVSPLAWSNTYRNFQGGRLYWEGENWNIDGFVVNPVNGAASPQAFRPNNFDQPDESVIFSGVYATYKNAPNGVMDLFWLWNEEDEPVTDRQDGSRHTIGLRYAGDYAVKEHGDVVRTWDWNLLGGWQFGDDSFIEGGFDQDVNAGFISTIGGVTFNDVAWSPKLTGLFWWGSGDSNRADGDINTVFTYYPLGHAYWGLIDNFNGANLLDYSLQGSVKPAKQLTLAAHWHWFDKASANDYIYNIAGAPLGSTAVRNRNIGNELDLLATYQFSKNLQVQAGYFWFWYGPAVQEDPALMRRHAQQFYVMTTWNY